MIDELPVLATLGTFGGSVTVSGAGGLRVRESDRIAELVAGLRDGRRRRGTARRLPGALRHAPHGRRRARASRSSASPAFGDRRARGHGPTTINGPMPWQSPTCLFDDLDRPRAATACTRRGREDGKVYLVGLHGRASRASHAPWAGGSIGRPRTSTRASSRSSVVTSRRFSRLRASPIWAREREALINLLPERGAVIASGGGTFADASNRELMRGRRGRLARRALRNHPEPGAPRRSPAAGRGSSWHGTAL